MNPSNFEDFSDIPFISYDDDQTTTHCTSRDIDIQCFEMSTGPFDQTIPMDSCSTYFSKEHNKQNSFEISTDDTLENILSPVSCSIQDSEEPT